MTNKEGDEFFHNLHRKELQSLCKKCGLPAKKSSSEMAESLVNYFQNKDLNFMSFVPTLQSEVPLNMTRNFIKDNFELRSCPREESNHGNRNVKCNKLETCVGLEAYNKETVCGLNENSQEACPFQFVSQYASSRVNQVRFGSILEDAPQLHFREINTGACHKENASFSIEAPTKVPASFEFYVSSEEGIKLCVDLNSSPSNWITRYKNQVYLCENMSNTKSRCLHQELGCVGESNKQMKSSFLQSMNPGQIKDDHVQAEPSPSLVTENNIRAGIGHPDGGNKSLMSLPIIPCGVAVDVLKSVEEHQEIRSAKPCSGMLNQITANNESCCKNRSANLDPDIINPPIEKSGSNFVVNSISDGSVALKHQNSKHNDEGCENSTLQNSCYIENARVVFPGCLASHSLEMQLSEAGNYQKDGSFSPHKNGEFLDPDDSKHNIGNDQDAVANSSVNNHSVNHLPACSEEQEWSNVACGMKSSMCSQVDNSFEKICLKSGKVESIEFHRKRPLMDSDGHNGCSKHDAKILRSMKHSTGEVLPRRSMRLVSKILHSLENSYTHARNLQGVILQGSPRIRDPVREREGLLIDYSPRDVYAIYFTSQKLGPI